LAQRHEKIFERIDKLALGASFVLISDHDPKPLYDQLETEYRNQLLGIIWKKALWYGALRFAGV
jgi:uncharacterized protein (DUF2249 family)